MDNSWIIKRYQQIFQGENGRGAGQQNYVVVICLLFLVDRWNAPGEFRGQPKTFVDKSSEKIAVALTFVRSLQDSSWDFFKYFENIAGRGEGVITHAMPVPF